jgi:hypothetical protein
MTPDWMLFIYALPSQPSRKRASIWRELKKLGAVYLRDGVVVLPRRQDLEERLRAMVSRVEEFDGTADLVVSPNFVAGSATNLVHRFQEERAGEYAELHRAGLRFLRDVLSEVDQEDFGFPDVDNLESELGRLHRWRDQIAERDYFRAPGAERVDETLSKCQRAFEGFAATASDRAGVHDPSPAPDDVFERLGESRVSQEPLPEDYPL